MDEEQKRQALNSLLLTLDADATAYFQVPEDTKMEYPCFVYEVDDIFTRHASNRTYTRTRRYQVTYISRDVTNTNHEKVAELPMSSFSRYFVADQLHHYVYSLYF